MLQQEITGVALRIIDVAQEESLISMFNIWTCIIFKGLIRSVIRSASVAVLMHNKVCGGDVSKATRAGECELR